MVQRKVPIKFGAQADYGKSKKRLGNLKPLSYQHQDGKIRGPDKKKQMKRSRSIKLSDIESFNSSTLRKTMSQPGKMPPHNASTTAATPQKQHLMLKTTGGSPNYMKATSSSEARKERSQVSSLNTPTASDAKKPGRRNSGNSKLSSASSNTPTRTLTKSSSLKLVRTLTKTPSFKPARSAAKKCSRVALCADMDVHKATCSSTLKDSTFPEYLMLNPGARRRTLKAEKKERMEVLSPRRAKAVGDRIEVLSSQPLIFSNDKPPHEEADFMYSTKIPMVKEVDVDFFVEIYAKITAVGPEATEKHTGEDDEGTIGFGEPSKRDSKCSFHGGEAAEQDNVKQVDENLSDSSSHLETDFEEICGQNNYIHPAEIWTTHDFLEEKAENVDGAYPPILSQEARKEWCGSESGSEISIEEECQASMKEDDSISDARDMEWEEGQISTSGFDTEAHYLDKSDKESSVSVECLDIKKFNLTDEPEIVRSDDIISNCTEEILADEVLQELFEEETAYFDTHCIDGDSESEGLLQTWEIETTQVDGDLAYDDQLSSVEYAFEEPTVEKNSEDAKKDLTCAVTASASMEEPIVESAAVNENNQEDGVCDTEHNIFEKNPQRRDAENDCSTNITTEALNVYQGDKSLQAEDATELLQGQISSSQSLDENEIGNAETNEGQKSKETESDQNLAISASAIKEQEQVVNAELSLGIQISDSSQSYSTADQDDSEDNDNQNQIIAEAYQLDEIAEDSSSSQKLPDQNCPGKDGQNESQHLFGKHQGGANKFKIQTSMDYDEQTDSRIHQISSARHITGEVEKMEVEVCKQSDIAETLFTTNNGINAGSGSKFLHKGNNFSQELASTFNNRKWTIKCKKPIMDKEEERKFNPTEPNFLPLFLTQRQRRLISGIRTWMTGKMLRNGCLIMHSDKLSPNLLQLGRGRWHYLLKLLKKSCLYPNMKLISGTHHQQPLLTQFQFKLVADGTFRGDDEKSCLGTIYLQ
ncbi:hypothetical protein GH714_036915 [Hevea brasiliensis]|uniref:Calmodulin-binding domain-containing protein n=1 Tax=Hevea brasiliensis TaxID=3981 RepID=A0A6A6NF55_HEVBR|nr:hypothetical protein GH714_036915 [Hevea brasiliensis]